MVVDVSPTASMSVSLIVTPRFFQLHFSFLFQYAVMCNMNSESDFLLEA